MGNIISNKLGLKVALIVNFFILVIFTMGTIVLIANESKRLENDLLSRGKQQSLLGAEIVGTVIEKAIENGALIEDDAFDTGYKRMKDFSPPKFHTKYDKYMDQTILSIQDEFLNDDNILYAIGSDKNGYVPTHNSRFQQPMTGDPEKDKSINRTKRIFDDPIGLKAAKNRTSGYLQIYPRDTGEIIWDISSPIMVNDRHWGGFRVGISLATISVAKKKLALNLFGIMASVVLTSILLTFFIVNRYLTPVRVLSNTANGLAKGRKLKDEILATSTDEIGELQQALERLRLSMLIALKRVKKT